MNVQPRIHDSSWDDCPAGTLLGVVRQNRLQRKRKRRTLMLVPILAILFVGAATPILLKIRQLEYPQSGAFSCDQVAILLPEYSARTLPAATAKQVQLHLRNCPACRGRLRQLQHNEPHGDTSRTHRSSTIVAVAPTRRYHSQASSLRIVPRYLPQQILSVGPVISIAGKAEDRDLASDTPTGIRLSTAKSAPLSC